MRGFKAIGYKNNYKIVIALTWPLLHNEVKRGEGCVTVADSSSLLESVRCFGLSFCRLPFVFLSLKRRYFFSERQGRLRLFSLVPSLLGEISLVGLRFIVCLLVIRFFPSGDYFIGECRNNLFLHLRRCLVRLVLWVNFLFAFSLCLLSSVFFFRCPVLSL